MSLPLEGPAGAAPTSLSDSSTVGAERRPVNRAIALTLRPIGPCGLTHSVDGAESEQGRFERMISG
jgi:hypothetical protein